MFVVIAPDVVVSSITYRVTLSKTPSADKLLVANECLAAVRVDDQFAVAVIAGFNAGFDWSIPACVFDRKYSE